MTTTITRHTSGGLATIGLTADASEAVQFPASGMLISLYSGLTSSVDVYACPTHDGTFKKVRKDGGDLNIAVSVEYWDGVDVSVFPAYYLKFVGNATGILEWMGKS